ncbi:hypothetical protein FHG87_000161 [Trinorchestia longiramus]|nr:hypothetical protein FHG87_000161 [Trinorchestia longiramus]
MNTFLAFAISILSVAGTRGDYGGGSTGVHENVIVLPASLSKAHPWAGFGNHYAEFVPKFFKPPRWLPGYDPTYSASWVPFAPKPRSQSYNSRGDAFMYASNGFINIDSSIPQGFGPPKDTSISSGIFGGQRHQYNPRRQSSSNQESFINFSDQTRNFQSQSPIYNQQFHVNNRRQHFPSTQVPHYPSSFSPSFDPLNHNVLSNPLQLQVLERDTKPSTESSPLHSHIREVKPPSRTNNIVGLRHLASTLHVGSRQPGAAPPEALGIIYNHSESKDVNQPQSPRSTSTFQQSLGAPSSFGHPRVPGQSYESVVSSFYTHSQ